MWRGVLVVVIVLASAQARASERSARLVYMGTACSAEELAAQVIALFGRDPFTQDGELVVGVAVEAEPGSDTGIDVEPARVRATIEIPGARVRTRRLEAASCRELADALAFVIVMALAEPGPRASDIRKAVKPAGAVQKGDSKAPFGALGGPRRVRLDALAGAEASVRLRPQAYIGVRARRGWTSAALELAAELPDSFAAGIGRVTIDRATAMLATCAHRGPFAGCATLAAGAFRGRGEGFMDSRSALMPMAVAGARVAWERAITGRLRLHVRGEAGVVLTRNRFLVDDAVVWSSERVEGRLGIGMLVRFR